MSAIKFGGKIEVKLLCYARPDDKAENGFKLLLVEPDFKWYTNEDDVCIATVPVEYYPPENMNYEEFVRKAVESLRDKQKQTLAAAQRQVDIYEEKINKLLMLTHQPKDDNVIDISA